MYLPAAFLYNFNARQFPPGIQENTGHGFNMDATGSAPPYGVALLQAPFWAVGHAWSRDKSGFSLAVYKAVDVAGATYYFAGVWLVIAALRQRFGRSVAGITTALLVLGTSLWYYELIETGMSHAYSFFAFALLLRQLGRARVAE